MKRRGDKIVMVTAYDAPAARLADEAGVELILVGDTAAMVMLGHESTVPVTLDEMIFLTARGHPLGAPAARRRRPAVRHATRSPTSRRSASAIRLVKEGGADVVKLEGAGRMASRVRAIAESNIGVMGHVGLTPQSATKLGGFRAQGRTADAALAALRRRARAAGGRRVRARARGGAGTGRGARSPSALAIPTIGIGAGAGCDGQVLVWHDLLGLYAGPTPRFVKRYAELADEIADALDRYVADVRSGALPGGAAHLLDPRRASSRSFEAALAAHAERERQRRASAARPRAATRRAGRRARAPRPAVDGADADHEQRSRPDGEHELRAARRPSPPVPESAPPRWKRRSP